MSHDKPHALSHEVAALIVESVKIWTVDISIEDNRKWKLNYSNLRDQT